MAKGAKKAAKKAKKESARAGEHAAGRVLANPRSTVKDRKLAAGVLSSAGKSKQTNVGLSQADFARMRKELTPEDSDGRPAGATALGRTRDLPA